MSISLKEKAISGFGWSAADNVLKLGITFVIGIILARLLTPDEYGLIGILTIFISIFNTIVDSGFTNALIRKQNILDIDYCTAFYTNLVLAIFMAFFLFCCSKPIAIFFRRDELVALTQVMSCIVVINAFSLVQKARMTKHIDFKTQTKVTLISVILSGIIGIWMAFQGYGVWALVGQQISSQLSTTICFWFFNKWIPRLKFSWDSFKDMWSFGWKLLVSSLIDTTWKEIYQVVVGKVYSPATLGLYTRANQFSQLFSSNMTSIVQRVSYPVLSSIQDDKVRLKSAYQKVIRTTMLPTFVFMLGMAASSKSMILVLIGEKWIECVPFLQLICLAGMLYPLHAINLNMLQVQGRSDLFLKLEIIKKCIAIGPLLLGIFIDIYLMVGCGILTSFICYYLNAYYSGPYLNYSVKEQIKDILPSFIIAVIMAIPVSLMSFLPINPFALFPLQVIAGAFITICLCEWKHLPEYIEIKEIFFLFVYKVFNR